MPRVKSSVTKRQKHKKVLKLSKGYYGRRSKSFKMANAAVMKSLNYARIHRKEKKRDFRKLWIARINAAARMNGMTYSRFIDGLRKANVQINRKMLADLAVSQPEAFSELVALAKNQVGAVGQSQ
ncbi:MAG: 50S ribosomal protein L20 [Firmicutes bacterium]|nr:50S ribosomal protein L20 [Candidatus Fermentithermobacillaceae bacterium]HON87071.1 50S ribosomal protein L20 [Bacillota bacterium]HOV65453.1 50S ribosomal protein L20 [Bacillota bacterium]HRC53091.1 50S ribosomal protein L20 [Bacillota bacterium]